MASSAPPGNKRPTRLQRGLIWARIIASLPRLSTNVKEMEQSFAGERDYETIVPPGPDGRPGYSVRTPSLSPYLGEVSIDGSRSDFRVLLDSNWASLGATCLGRTATVGDHEYLAQPTWVFTPDGGDMVTIDQNRHEKIGQLETIRTMKLLASGRMLIDWFFVHEGWSFIAGVLVQSGPTEEPEQAAKAVLETWQWSESSKV